MHIGPYNARRYGLYRMYQVVVVAPVYAYKSKTEQVTDKNALQRHQRFPIGTMGHFYFQNHYGNDDGQYAIAKRLQPGFIHTAIFGVKKLSQSYNYILLLLQTKKHFHEG
jgi:hypothetical protein